MSIRLTFDYNKAFHVILYLKDRLNKTNGKVLDKLILMKLIFFADKYHINKYGRFICGGRYVSMNNGHVHSEMFDLVKTHEKIQSLPNHGIDIQGVELELDEFSESDTEALDMVVNLYGHLSPSELIELSHEEPTWENSHGSSINIPIANIIESEKMKDYVSFQSQEQQSFENWASNVPQPI